MQKIDFDKLVNRVKRCRAMVYERSSAGFVLTSSTDDDLPTVLEVSGIKSPDTLEDELLTLFIWIWSMKDYLKALCKSLGVPPNEIELIANNSRALSVAADIANRAKHGTLKDSRCGDFARLDEVSITLPQSALRSIAFDRPTVRLDVGIPDDAELRATIAFDSGVPSVDAFVIADEALAAWVQNAFPLAQMP